jgi:hypothetical protein
LNENYKRLKLIVSPVFAWEMHHMLDTVVSSKFCYSLQSKNTTAFKTNCAMNFSGTKVAKGYNIHRIPNFLPQYWSYNWICGLQNWLKEISESNRILLSYKTNCHRSKHQHPSWGHLCSPTNTRHFYLIEGENGPLIIDSVQVT